MKKKLIPTIFLLLLFFQIKSQEKFVQKYFNLPDWQIIGPTDVPLGIINNIKQGIGSVECIEFDLINEDITYIGTHGGGVWKSINNAQSWIPLTDFLPSISISKIVVNPQNPQTIYIATGDKNYNELYSTGIYKSTDGGISWNETGLIYKLNEFKNINCLVINPNNPDVLIAGTNYGIIKSNNAGDSWQTVLPNVEIKCLEISYSNSNDVYATSFNTDGGARIYKSTNCANTFELSEPLNFPSENISRIELAFTKANTNVIYALCTDKTSKNMLSLYKSIDNGNIWEEIISGKTKNLLSNSAQGDNIEGNANEEIAIVVSNQDADNIIVGGTHLWKSTDGGYTFNLLKNCYLQNEDIIFAGQHVLKQNSKDELYLGNSGGIFQSDNFGVTWENKSKDLNILQSSNLDISTIGEEILLTTTKTNKTLLLKNESQLVLPLGEIAFNLIDYSNCNIVYSSTLNGEILKSENQGLNYENITPNSEFQGVAPIALHKSNSNVIYTANEKFYKSENKGYTWNTVCENPPWVNQISEIVTCYNSENIIYAITADEIWKSNDEGRTWLNITENLQLIRQPNSLNSISKYFHFAVNYSKPELIWVSVSDYINNQKVYKSIDGGETWENISKNLPNLKINCIVNQVGTNNGIYVGTDTGVFYIDDEITEWMCFNQNLPHSPISDLKIDYTTNEIIAATYGRGIWKTKLYKYENFEPITNFTVNNFRPCLNESVNLYDLTSYYPTYWKWDIQPNTFEFINGTNKHSQNPVVVFKQNGGYSVSLYSSNSYGFNSNFKTNFIFAGVPYAEFNFETDNSIVTFTNNSFNGENYMWDFDDGTLSIEKNPVHEYTSSRIYTATLDVSNSCGSDYISKNIIITNEIQSEKSNNFNIYPNPSNGLINISLENFYDKGIIEIFNINGISVYQNSITDINFTDNLLLKSGIYFCKIDCEECKLYRKIIIE